MSSHSGYTCAGGTANKVGVSPAGVASFIATCAAGTYPATVGTTVFSATGTACVPCSAGKAIYHVVLILAMHFTLLVFLQDLPVLAVLPTKFHAVFLPAFLAQPPVLILPLALRATTLLLRLP